MPLDNQTKLQPVCRTVTITLPTLQQLYDGLPKEQQSPDIYMKLRAAYQQEVSILLIYALSPQCQEPEIAMHGFRQAGSQWIAEFFTADRSRAWKPNLNFHGQNTSQWCYAGAIVFEDGQVSTHY